MQKGKDIPRICSLFLVSWGLLFSIFFSFSLQGKAMSIKKKKKENNKIVKLTIVFCLAIQSNTKKNTEQDIKCMNYQFAA